MRHIIISPISNELPSHYAERLAKYYASKTEQEHKKKIGQFFTPLALSNFIASFSLIDKRKIKILDPGCGTCILSSSLIEKLSKSKKIKHVELTTYEIDPNLNVHAMASLAYLNDWLSDKGITLVINHRSVDFLDENFLAIDVESTEQFDIIISNPPYFKISKEDQRKHLLKTISSGQLNMYAAFVAISTNMLTKQGELIFIIPRSFASGDYFKTFRSVFFSRIQVKSIHLFVSRKQAFEKDKVLQENLIIHGCRVSKVDLKKKIRVSQSDGLKDIGNIKAKHFPYNQLIDPNSDEKFLHLPDSEEQEIIMRLIQAQKNNLSSLGYKISTGPIVYFRKIEFLQQDKSQNSVPLFWLDNVNKYTITHPMNGKSKEQFFTWSEQSDSVLTLNTNLVLVRRFSSKDDSSRLVAAIHLKKTSANYQKIGIENKLNYISKIKGILRINEAIGICSILNSYIYDEYFKTFNGNTQVSASELRKIPFPSSNTILKIGKKISRLKTINPETVSAIVCKALLENANK